MAWTTIYLLLAWAGYRLTLIPGSEIVLALWAAQIALNTLWTPVFFGANRLVAAMVILVLLWIVVAVMIVMALQLDIITGLILFPYGLALGGSGAELLHSAPQPISAWRSLPYAFPKNMSGISIN